MEGIGQGTASCIHSDDVIMEEGRLVSEGCGRGEDEGMEFGRFP